MRLTFCLKLLLACACALAPLQAQTPALPAVAAPPSSLPEAPIPAFDLSSPANSASPPEAAPEYAAALAAAPGFDFLSQSSTSISLTQTTTGAATSASAGTAATGPATPAVSLSRQQPTRILGLMPNYRSVSGGVVPPPPTLRYNFLIASRQAFDYSSFVFLGLTSLAAKGLDEHPSLGKGPGGVYAYTWRGFLDKTDNTYLSAFLLPSILHEDGRYYARGEGPKWTRLGYAASRVVVTRTYGGHNTFNFAGIGGKVVTQAVSKTYYPAGSSNFGDLAEKFAFSIARDVGFTVFREFYPDIAVHALHRKP